MTPASTLKLWVLSGGVFIDAGYEEVILPALWEQQTFIDKAGPEIVDQMWAFKDKKGRPVCLIPEATALIQEMWREKWSRQCGSMRLFYATRCYRYERPQAGRYREFTQFGLEILGDDRIEANKEAVDLLKACLRAAGLVLERDYDLNTAVKRGLDYYTQLGFEASCPILGAQKQIAGGGRYAEGVGWAIGVDRLLLAKQKDPVQSSQRGGLKLLEGRGQISEPVSGGALGPIA
jgi:histidyl-tRNA synthetase